VVLDGRVLSVLMYKKVVLDYEQLTLICSRKKANPIRFPYSAMSRL
jgi:hypothetical protein